jgi:C4-dicarboxylate-specific signal transduction histidine kinase
MAPFVGMAIGGRRVAGVLLALALTVCVVVLTLQHGGWVHGPIDLHPRFGRELLMGMVVTVVLFLFGLVYDDASDAALSALRGSNEALVQEVHEHKATQVQLQKTYADLLRSARLAGMAEVATGVLHNIGNGLTSIKVSSDLLRTRKGDVEVAPALRRVGERLRSDTWSGTDRETLARYMDAVAARAERTHGEVLLELEQLSDRVDHVATVVSLQQEYTRAHAVVEPVLLGDVVREAALLAALDSAIDWTLDDSLDTIPSMLIERHKLVQIVVNVLTNARDAVATCPIRQVVIRATVRENECIEIEFHDSGIGLPTGEVDQIFRHGFTTKPKGNGFGLHVSALAAMELGGSLSAGASPEIAGACFRLQLPLRGQGQSVPVLRA